MNVPTVARKMWETDKLVLVNVPEKLTEKERQDWVRDYSKKASLAGDRLGLYFGEILYEVKKKEYWKVWKFNSFDEYVEKEINICRRKSYYLIQIYEKFVIELECPLDSLLHIPWNKAKELVSVITKENADELLKDLDKKTFDEVKKMKKKLSGSKSKDTSFKRMSFSLTDDQFDNVEQALDIAGQMSGSDKTGHLLDMICADFLSSRIAEQELGAKSLLNDINVHIDNLERVFGVKVEVKELDATKCPSYSDDKNN